MSEQSSVYASRRQWVALLARSLSQAVICWHLCGCQQSLKVGHANSTSLDIVRVVVSNVVVIHLSISMVCYTFVHWMVLSFRL